MANSVAERSSMGNAHDSPPDAYIFLPGIGQGWDGTMAMGFARRLASALERNTDAIGTKVEEQAAEFPPPLGRTEYARVLVSRVAPEPDHLVADVYSLDLANSIATRFERMNSLWKTVLMAVYSALFLLDLASFLWRRKVGPREKLQWVIGGAGLFVVTVTLFSSAAALIVSLGSYAPGFDGLDTFRNWAAPIAGSILAATALMPRRIRDGVDALAIRLLGLTAYIGTGEWRDVAVGRLAKLVVELRRTGSYGRIHLFGYSVGSVVVLDTIYPVSPAIQIFNEIDTIITVGCPADSIGAFWPDYFTRREGRAGRQPTWYNVFIPADLLASNFIDRDGESEYPDESERMAHREVTAQPVVNRAGVPSAADGVTSTDGRDDTTSRTGFGQKLLKAAAVPLDLATRSVEKAAHPIEPVAKAAGQALERISPLGERKWAGIRMRDPDFPEVVPNRNIRYSISTARGWSQNLLPAFKAHTSYWNRDDPSAGSIFDPLVRYLYDYRGMFPPLPRPA
ncbi:MAG: hypothetical protein HY678_08755, partial [Chloroflexi bacterium]|nr:hypothetical protein [Chloroflexota bacterium]